MTSATRQFRPPYDVITVHDCNGVKPPFAYTVGVHDAYGGAELFAWGRPDEGLDPGEQWMLSESDLNQELRSAVDRLVANGQLALGASWTSALDGDRTVLRVTVVEADDVPAYLVSPGTPVHRLHFRLVRPPIGRPTPLGAREADALTARVHRWYAEYHRPRPDVSVALDQPFGPATAGVRLILDYLNGLDPHAIWVAAVLEARNLDCSGSATAEAEAVARTAGRLPWVEAARFEASRLVELRLLECDPDDRDKLRWFASPAFRAAVTAWVLADIVDDELFRRGTATVRAISNRDLGLEHEAPADAESCRRVREVATAIRRGWQPPDSMEASAARHRAAWLTAASGRGGALADLTEHAPLPAGIAPDLALDVLRAAIVLDIDPGLSVLLPDGVAACSR